MIPRWEKVWSYPLLKVWGRTIRSSYFCTCWWSSWRERWYKFPPPASFSQDPPNQGAKTSEEEVCSHKHYRVINTCFENQVETPQGPWDPCWVSANKNLESLLGVRERGRATLGCLQVRKRLWGLALLTSQESECFLNFYSVGAALPINQKPGLFQGLLVFLSSKGEKQVQKYRRQEENTLSKLRYFSC